MGLFDRKFCDICGAKIGLLGNRKLDDGNCCKDCAAKLSPWFTGRKKSTVEQIKDQLAYREANKQAVENFNTTKSLGSDYKLLIDEDAKKFCVSRTGRLANENTDILDYGMVTGCIFDIEDSKDEITTKDAQGNTVSYRPPRYEYEYDFYVTIHVNHPYFDEMHFRINNESVRIESAYDPKPQNNSDYVRFNEMGIEIKNTVEAMRQGARDEVAAASAPRIAVKCPHCGATTYPEGGRCEYCGGAVS
ncbi:MAG TPA: DUF4428 domain-containing protein [Bacillota bacterium]|nr:DUF4428 domain-containing protein [Bacillota bacterium]HQC35891.1 DUF4428 domain-containing protein [Bacillota bacterium]